MKSSSVLSLTTCDNLHARWNFHEIRAIFLRRYLLQYTALELFLSSRTAVMFAFPDHDTVKKVVAHLPRVGVGVKYGLPQNRRASLMTPKQLFKHSDMPQKWQQREISNFDYLMFLNTVSGRTYNDLNQYPVFPWVLSNYSADKLDLNDAANFRDLSKPVGALSESRRKHFLERFNNWEDNEVPAFHYGTHYSTQAFTLNWLFRIEPFTTLFLDLQSGKFDHSNRLFHSLTETWEHCLNDTHDVKELIPELFYLPEMFHNNNKYELGTREDGTVVDDVCLPQWSNGNAEEFVRMHRQALESDLVSCQLHQWVDLIFGYKQRGPEAVRATNVFYHLTYEGSVDLGSIENVALRESIQQQILNFGQSPAQLLSEPHPPRHSVMTVSPMMFQPYPNDLCMLMKFISNSPIVHIAANTYHQLTEPSVVTIAQNLVFALNRWNPNFMQAAQSSQSSSVLNVSSADKDKCPPGVDSPAQISTSELPITVDPLLAVGNPSHKVPKRHLGDQLDQRLTISWNNFICTVDSRFIIVCGYPDYSFRLIETENAQVRQVVFGHGNVVTCLARSETSLFADCYVASGSSDCTVVLWHFSQHSGMLVGDYNVQGEEPSPRAILTGHDSEISAICVSAEHGIVLSGSKDGALLMHSTQGDLLRNICADIGDDSPNKAINNILFSRDCHIAVFFGNDALATFSTTGQLLKQPMYKSAERILCAVLSRDGEYIVLGTDNGRILILRLFSLQLLYTFAQTDSPIRSLAISTNQRLIFGGLDSGAIVVFNVDFNRWHCEYDGSRFSSSNR
uniref:Putative neurobeachin homolog n=1 Tax=Globodera rostochiensis TaxID=31243 RepID=A0A914GZ52_GLORO